MYELHHKTSLIPKDVNKAFWKQLQYVNIAYTTYFLFGITRGYPAFLLKQLKDADSIIKTDVTSESWIASLNIFPNPIGSVLAGILMDKVGRKLMLRLSMLLFALGWATMACSNDLTSLYAGNVVVGLAIGMGVCSTTYVAEICEVRNRCMLLSFLEIHYALGVHIAYVSTCFMEWNSAALIFTLFSILSSILLHGIPESPLWLIKQGRTESALASFKRTFPDENNEEVEAQFKSLEKTTNEELRVIKTFTAIAENVKAFVILVTFHVLLQGTGYNVLLTYLTDFLIILQLPENTVKIVAIGYSVASFVASFLTPFTVNYWPRRMATMVSGMGIAVSCTFIGVYSAFLNFPGAQYYWYIVPLNLYLFLIFCTIGVLTLSQSMIGELYPIEVRGIMCGLTEAVGTVLSGLTVVLYPHLKHYLSMQILFYVFAFFGILTVIYGYYVLPETYGKSLNEIQHEYFRKKVRKSINVNESEDKVGLLPA